MIGVVHLPLACLIKDGCIYLHTLARIFSILYACLMDGKERNIPKTGKNRQYRLIPNTFNPLIERLGSKFFDVLPNTPGIYKMLDNEGRLLYVGKAKNLRRRLLTYRRARNGNVSRKTVRLLRQVHHIRLEYHETEEQALLRENELIRSARPPFNRAKKQPETYYFVHLLFENNGVNFHLNMKEKEDGRWYSYGAFKGHRLTRRAMGALLRHCYARTCRLRRACEFPVVLVRNLTPLNYRLEVPGTKELNKLGDALRLYLSGEENTLTNNFIFNNNVQKPYPGFTRAFLEADREILDHFFHCRARANRLLAEEMNLNSSLIPQAKLDDALVKARFGNPTGTGIKD